MRSPRSRRPAAAAGRMASPKRTRRLSGTAQPERGSRSGRDRSHGLRRLLRPTTAYRSPRGAAIQRFGVRNVNGVTTVFGVVGKEVDARCRAAWLHVALVSPIETPNLLGPRRSGFSITGGLNGPGLPERSRVFCTGPAFRFRPWPATHRRAKRARRGAFRANGVRCGSAFLLLPGMWRGGTMTKLSQLIARLRATLKR